MSELPLCACVWAADPDATRDALVALAGRAALVELRLDRVAPDYPVGPVIGAAPLPVLATCRPPREGGAWSGDEGARLALLQRAVDAGARWVDLEWDVDPGAVVGALRLRSRHVFEPTAPASFDALLASLGAGDLGKLAVAVEGAEQALELLERAARVRPCPLVVALGPDGVAARVLGPSYGQPWTYAAHDPRDPTGPGQLDLTGLTRLWRGGRARAEAAYGVVGSPVGHSRSPALFNHLFAELGVDALYSWLQTADPQALWNRCAADPRWRGFSVTTPHKQAAAAWARARGTLSPAAEATGAVNTLSRAGDAWRADNTDARALRELLAPAGLSGRDA
ncbi:MAG: type I 3-dehydroquinate dehydratase, partial [Planctomycetes bacterium]|nr:type I 3-dehydroquinate dehydratase [Planctomycetota bacterium]